jgi:hypothetical protein
MSRIYPMGFDACQDEVEGRMRVGGSLGGVEATIQRAEITDDERAALWLLAWSMQTEDSASSEAAA